MCIQLYVSLHFYLLYLLLNSCVKTTACQIWHIFETQCTFKCLTKVKVKWSVDLSVYVTASVMRLLSSQLYHHTRHMCPQTSTVYDFLI